MLPCPVDYPLRVHPLCNVVVTSAFEFPSTVNCVAKVSEALPMKLAEVIQETLQKVAN